MPGLHTARYVPGAAGVYRIDVNITDATAYTTNTRGGGTAGMLDETVTRFVRAGAERKEYFQPTRNDALLKRMAESTSGRYWPAADVDGLVTSLTFGNTGIRSVEVLPLWHLPLFFLLLILLKIVEWGPQAAVGASMSIWRERVVTTFFWPLVRVRVRPSKRGVERSNTRPDCNGSRRQQRVRNRVRTTGYTNRQATDQGQRRRHHSRSGRGRRPCGAKRAQCDRWAIERR